MKLSFRPSMTSGSGGLFEIEGALVRVLIGSTALLLGVACVPATARVAPTDDNEPATNIRLDEALSEATDRGADIATRLAAVHELLTLAGNADTIAKLAILLDVREPPAVGQAVLEAMVKTERPEAVGSILDRWSGLSPTTREKALQLFLARPDACRQLFAALRQDCCATGRLRPADLGARFVELLRNHDNAAISREARAVFAELDADTSRDKKVLLEQLRPHVLEREGNPLRGEVVFEKQCSVCHEYEGRGKDIGPNLTGMGLLGREALLHDTHHPNRVVEGPYVAYTVVKQSGEAVSGMLASEDAASLVLKRNGGVDVIARDEVLSFESQGVSLMPEGLEKTMTAEDLRDLLTYLAKKSRYRALNLRLAANADGSRGLFTMHANVGEALAFPQYGAVEVEGVPFLILNPATTAGRNLVVLRGGPERAPEVIARSYPRRAEIPCGTTAKTLYFLGGVGGWAFPTTKEEFPVVNLTLHYQGGASETVVWRNGVEIADCHRTRNVPGSKRAVRWGRHQVRLLTWKPARGEVIERIELVSQAGPVAPVLVAVTVEL